METVLLAAGSASRMGSPKLLLPFNGKPMVAHALTAALESSERVILVTGWYEPELIRAIEPMLRIWGEKIVIVRNDQSGLGQFSSTRIGVAEVTEGAPFALALADAPLATPAHYRRLEPLLDGYEAVRPYCNGIPGHPVLCAPPLRREIISLPVTASMREFLAGRNVLKFEDGDAAWITDIDTPESYQKLINGTRIFVQS